MHKAFLLAAGMGTRLRPLTNEVPKILLPVGEETLLNIWLDHLTLHHVDQVLINTHWLHEKVKAFLKTCEKEGLDVTVSYEKKLLGSAGTVWANRKWIDDGSPFFILYGDNLTDVDLGTIMTFHREHGLPLTLGVFKPEDLCACGVVETDKDGIVTAFIEKPEHPSSDLAAAGVYIADKRIFDYFPDEKDIPPDGLDFGKDIFPRMAGDMKVYEIQEFLMDLGTVESYNNAQKQWSEVKR